jgi:hypothetical protein
MTGHFADPRDGGPDLDLFAEHSAEILDISQTGICLRCAHVPPGDREIWVAVADPTSRAWSRVDLRSLSEPELGQFLLRLAFTEGCSYDLFKVAILQPFRDSIIDGKASRSGTT